MMFESIFSEISAILVIAVGLSIFGLVLRQPLIVAFLLAGVLTGPFGFGIIESHDNIELLGHIGISILLFVVGLRLDIQLVRTTGPVAIATGLGQITFTILLGFVITLGMDMPLVNSIYVSVTMAFSSTIIIVKLLSDKKEIDALHGRIAMGFLIVQDIVAILVLIIITALGGETTGDLNTLWDIVLIAGKGLGFLLGVALCMRYILPSLTGKIAGNQELLVLFSVSWAVFLGALGDYLGFSKEVGAFLGGISLASTPYREAIGARLVSLRDFLLLFFFIDLGSRLEFSEVVPQLGKAAILSMFVLIGNPMIIIIIMGIMGYRRRTGFLAGLSVAQISEFSLILAALGVSLGHITRDTMALVTLIGVTTIFISTYLILNSGTLYEVVSPIIRIFERKHPYREMEVTGTCDLTDIDLILVGLGTYGSSVAEDLIKRKKKILGVDFDPHVLKTWKSREISVMFGDAGDPEFLDQLPLGCSRWFISMIRDRKINLSILRHLKTLGYEGHLVLSAGKEEDAEAYEQAGAHFVLRPYRHVAEHTADTIIDTMN
jgi:Kef-type K+ transport system membrane component KefB